MVLKSEKTEINHLPEIRCVFCSEPWSEENLLTYDLDARDHCDSGRFYQECCTIEIKCHSCQRVMYRKEGFKLGY